MVFFIFIQILIEHTFCKQTVETLHDQSLHSAASALGLHYLPTSHKKDARLIWLNTAYWVFSCF